MAELPPSIAKSANKRRPNDVKRAHRRQMLNRVRAQDSAQGRTQGRAENETRKGRNKRRSPPRSPPPPPDVADGGADMLEIEVQLPGAFRMPGISGHSSQDIMCSSSKSTFLPNGTDKNGDHSKTNEGLKTATVVTEDEGTKSQEGSFLCSI